MKPEQLEKGIEINNNIKLIKNKVKDLDMDMEAYPGGGYNIHVPYNKKIFEEIYNILKNYYTEMLKQLEKELEDL
jgi:hypothetical protein